MIRLGEGLPRTFSTAVNQSSTSHGDNKSCSWKSPDQSDNEEKTRRDNKGQQVSNNHNSAPNRRTKQPNSGLFYSASSSGNSSILILPFRIYYGTDLNNKDITSIVCNVSRSRAPPD